MAPKKTPTATIRRPGTNPKSTNVPRLIPGGGSAGKK